MAKILSLPEGSTSGKTIPTQKPSTILPFKGRITDIN